jgi:hypothetical protein
MSPARGGCIVAVRTSTSFGWLVLVRQMDKSQASPSFGRRRLLSTPSRRDLPDTIAAVIGDQ